MASIFSIADEVAVALGFTHDDALNNKILLSYYVKLAVDKLQGRRISKDYNTDVRKASDSLETFIVDVTHQTAPFATGSAGAPYECLYFELPATLLDLPFDGGLAWVRYHRPSLPLNCPPSIAGAIFGHTTLGALSTLWGMGYQKPTPSRPLIARDKYRVYVFGVNPLIKKLHVGLFCALPDLADMDPNATLSIPDEQLMDVRKLVLDSARFSLMLPERLKNDGADIHEPIRTEKQTSINDGINVIGNE